MRRLQKHNTRHIIHTDFIYTGDRTFTPATVTTTTHTNSAIWLLGLEAYVTSPWSHPSLQSQGRKPGSPSPNPLSLSSTKEDGL